MRRYGLAAAFALLIVVNVIVLAGIRYNRAGEPEATLELTEREVPLAWSGNENSGTSLRLEWQRDEDRMPNWIDRGKLAQAGFDCSLPPGARDADLFYGKALPRKAYAVLEFDGPAWMARQDREQKKLEVMAAGIARGKTTRKELAAAAKRFAWEEVTASRLFAVDVGTDPALLRSRYPDRHRYIITPAVVRLRFEAARQEKGKIVKPAAVTGSIGEILTGTINVPHDRQGLLGKFRSGREPWRAYYYEGQKEETPTPPRYRVLLHYGQRLEPWVAAVLPSGGQRERKGAKGDRARLPE